MYKEEGFKGNKLNTIQKTSLESNLCIYQIKIQYKIKNWFPPLPHTVHNATKFGCQFTF